MLEYLRARRGDLALGLIWAGVVACSLWDERLGSVLGGIGGGVALLVIARVRRGRSNWLIASLGLLYFAGGALAGVGHPGLLKTAAMVPFAVQMVWLWRNRHDPEINYDVDLLGRRKVPAANG